MTTPSAADLELCALTDAFLGAVAALTDAEFGGPTSLPGWTRAHVVAHVHFNAEALRRLTRWAATGLEQRMYANPHERNTQIEQGAAWAPRRLRSAVAESAAALGDELNALSPPSLDVIVVTAQGRSVPASEIYWLRSREVGVHAVDLNSGTTFEDLPPLFNSRLIQDIAAKRSSSPQAPALAAWLSGRSVQAPELTPWL